MMKSSPIIWALPFLTACIGSAVIIYGFLERDRSIKDVEGLFEAHITSVASLAKQGTREAAAVTSLMYDLTEEHLLTTAHLLAVSYESKRMDADLLDEEEWRVRIIVTDDDRVQGDWGDIPVAAQKPFIESMRRAKQGEIVWEGPAQQYGLICLYHRVEKGMAIICRDARRVGALKSEIGIGPLMKELVKTDILYIFKIVPGFWPWLLLSMGYRPGRTTQRFNGFWTKDNKREPPGYIRQQTRQFLKVWSLLKWSTVPGWCCASALMVQC